MEPNVWLVLEWKVIADEDKVTSGRDVLEVQGVFNSAKNAEAICKNSRYVVMPLTMNEDLTQRHIESGYYPVTE